MRRTKAIAARLARGPTQVAGGLIVAQIFTAVALLLIARRLVVEEFGAFAALYATSLAIAAMVDFGSSQLWTRELATSPDALDRLMHNVWRRAILSLPSVAIVALYGAARSRAELSFTTVALVSLQPITYLLSAGWSAAIRALDSPARATWYVAAGNLWFVVIVALAPKRLLLEAAAFGATTSWLLTAFLSYVRLRPRRTASAVSGRRSNPWAGASHLGLYTVLASVQRLDIALVSALSGRAEAGLLAAVTRWDQPISLLANAVALHQFPDFARARSLRQARSLLRSGAPLLAFAAVLAGLIFVLAPSLVESTLGPAYSDAVPILRLVSIGVLPTLIALPLGSLLQAQGHERFATGARAVSTVVYLLVIGLGAHHFGGIASPIATLVAGVGVAAVYSYVVLTARDRTDAADLTG
jgi:O-antigen/teichoic acid export membrane protein